MTKIAVILFPGTNCENETVRICRDVGMTADIVRWNAKLNEYDGYILPGGWSYEDRVRAGAIAAKDKVIDKIKEEADKGKVVLGLCNGAQVLIEAGLVPGNGKIGLAPNVNPKVSGYYCSWINVLAGSRVTAFTDGVDKVTRMTVAHGEGRFVCTDLELMHEMESNSQILYKYCDENGIVDEDYPINPNGSFYNIAGLCNKAGNVMALMPHPERASWSKQLYQFERKSGLSPGSKIFASIKTWIENAR